MTNSTARLMLYLLITLFIMSNTISHMFGEVKPFDWIMLAVEVLVLLFIAYEVFVGVIQRRGKQRRQSELNERVQELSQFMDKGKNVLATIPSSYWDGPQSIGPWMETMRVWTEETNMYLVSHSSRASAIFLLDITNAVIPDRIITAGKYFAITASAHSTHPEESGDSLRECYHRLTSQLDNLRRIMERPEAYF